MPIAVANPLPFTEIAVLSEELHADRPVTSCVVPSEKSAVTANCTVKPFASERLNGPSAIEIRVAEETVSVVLALIPPLCAPIVVLPGATGLAKPEPLIVAALRFEELQ